ncbi:uncharacterized protein LOC116424391 [Nomia melanderi]|uniref:uncharacterized protein LOC116424391 n=1 Tax=Nomia melanderi TaxID=2448451 RepID=UPI003FCDEF32
MQLLYMMDYVNEGITPILIILQALQVLLSEYCYKSRNRTESNTWCKMLLVKSFSLFTCLIVLTAGAAVKTPAETVWTNIASKPVYSRALGPPPSTIDTITVPYMPKSPLFPKFVDPKMMISKKTDLLSNLFGGLGPAYPTGSVYPMAPTYPMAPFKPFMPYTVASGPTLYGTANEASLSSLDKSKIEDDNIPYKRGIFGPFSSPTPFGPMSPKFGPMSSKFGSMNPMSQYSELNTIPNYSMKSDFSRKRRSIDESSLTKLRSIMDGSKSETKDLIPPPPYPTLAPISEESEEDINLLLQKVGSATAPKQYLPGMFGPFSPFAPIMDPSMFIAKKSAFLDTLFKNLATTTPTPATSTEIPTTKSTIVPPDFWFPSSMIPSPDEYGSKVNDFLDKLFESLKLNKTAVSSDSDSTSMKSDFLRSVKFDEEDMQTKVARSIDDLSSINAAKDAIVDSILTELGDLKSNMVATMNDLVTYEKSVSGTATKKPFKPFAPGIWPKPITDGTLPFQQKMATLSQVFDMLSDLQKNITLAVQNAIKTKVNSSGISGSVNSANPILPDNAVSGAPINISLLDALKSKLGTLDYDMPNSYATMSDKFGPIMTRTLQKTPGSFWVSYPEEKREVDSDSKPLINGETNMIHKQETRGVKMQMHQGYQSLPAGSIESVQAGGGSMPGHQGGGIKLFIQMPVLPSMQDINNYEEPNKWTNWMDYLRSDYQGHRHHKHH